MQIYEYFISYNSLAFSLCQIIQISSRTRGVSIPRIIIQAYVTMFICILMHSIGMLGSIYPFTTYCNNRKFQWQFAFLKSIDPHHKTGYSICIPCRSKTIVLLDINTYEVCVVSTYHHILILNAYINKMDYAHIFSH